MSTSPLTYTHTHMHTNNCYHAQLTKGPAWVKAFKAFSLLVGRWQVTNWNMMWEVNATLTPVAITKLTRDTALALIPMVDREPSMWVTIKPTLRVWTAAAHRLWHSITERRNTAAVCDRTRKQQTTSSKPTAHGQLPQPILQPCMLYTGGTVAHRWAFSNCRTCTTYTTHLNSSQALAYRKEACNSFSCPLSSYAIQITDRPSCIGYVQGWFTVP